MGSMPELGPPISPQIAGALARFFRGGDGPSHSVLSTVFMETGFHDADPGSQVNKQTRVQRVLLAAGERPAQAQHLIEALLSEMRASHCFDAASYGYSREYVRGAQRAFADAGWELTADGELRFSVTGDVAAVAGRPVIEAQLERLRRAADDPELLIGTAKEMLESTAKYVLEETGKEYRPAATFDELWGAARRAVGVHPEQVDTSLPGGTALREIVQSAWSIARQVNALRAQEGTGHGRTVLSGLSRETALFVVREACSVAEFMLAALDRHLSS